MRKTARIYLDVSCLSRPFDDQEQARIRLEAAAVVVILERIDRGEWLHVSSEMATLEINAIPDPGRRARVQMLLPDAAELLPLTEQVFTRAAVLERIGLKPADAVHLAAAEQLGADLLLSCDDRFCRKAQKHRKLLHVDVRNPVDWLQEVEGAVDA